MHRPRRCPRFGPFLACLLGLLPAVHSAQPAARPAPPPLKSLRLGADDVALRIHYVARHPSREAWLTLERLGGRSTADYQLIAASGELLHSPLPAPQVSWPEVWQEMTATGFYSLPDENATPPCETEPIPVDAPQVAVEVRQGNHLHHFGYGAPLSRECPAALRAATTLRFLQDAFDHALPFP